MKNPAEEIVTAWLQECKGFFTMNNIKVPKEGGGMGAEIDILATGKRKKVWVEVSVSTHPRCIYKKDIRFQSFLGECLKDFKRPDKKQMVTKYFGRRFEKWFVFGKLPLPKTESDRFPSELKRRGVEPISFADILRDLSELKYYRLDAARGYINLFKTFREAFPE